MTHTNFLYQNSNFFFIIICLLSTVPIGKIIGLKGGRNVILVGWLGNLIIICGQIYKMNEF